MIKISKTCTNNYITETKVPGGDYVINPYIGCPHKCIYCYAAFMKKFTGHKEPWGNFLDVKISEWHLNTKKLISKKVVISSVTDAYNKYERKYKITRRILKDLVEIDTEVNILTKSNLVIRDIDLFKKMHNVEIVFSLNTLDDTFRKYTEPFASSVSERIEALKILSKNGLKTAVFLSPMFPGITDFNAIIRATKKYSQGFWFENLNLYPYSAKKILKYINRRYPHLKDLYDEIYVKKDMQYWNWLERVISVYCDKNNIACKMYFHHKKIRKK